MKKLSFKSPAKINRFLHVCGRREDGYHNLQTVFQFLSIADDLTFSLRQDDVITLSPAFADVAFEDNLIIRAARALQLYMLAKGNDAAFGADIAVTKVLPQGGGIGGGSSNAATALYGLNQLWDLQLSTDELKQIGLTLGADVPIFLHAHAAWAEGVGETFTDVILNDSWLLLAIPDCHVSTAEIFSHSLLTRDSKIKTIAAFLEQGGANSLISDFHNDCESLVRQLYPNVDEAIKLLSQFGKAQMTGTGACAFVLFDSREAAYNAQQLLPEFLQTVVCKAVNRSPMLTNTL